MEYTPSGCLRGFQSSVVLGAVRGAGGHLPSFIAIVNMNHHIVPAVVDVDVALIASSTGDDAQQKEHGQQKNVKNLHRPKIRRSA